MCECLAHSQDLLTVEGSPRGDLCLSHLDGGQGQGALSRCQGLRAVFRTLVNWIDHNPEFMTHADHRPSRLLIM